MRPEDSEVLRENKPHSDEAAGRYAPEARPPRILWQPTTARGCHKAVIHGSLVRCGFQRESALRMIRPARDSAGVRREAVFAGAGNGCSRPGGDLGTACACAPGDFFFIFCGPSGPA